MFIRFVIRALVMVAVVVGAWGLLQQFDVVEISLYLLGAAGFIVLAVASYLDRRGR